VYFQRNFRLLTFGPEINNVLAKPVEENEWEQIPLLFDYMLQVMRKADALGLAAPQIGCFKQFVLIQRNHGIVTGLVNPEIIRLYGREIEGVEACEGLPPSGNGCMVPRLEIVDVEAALAETPYLRRKFTFRGIVARTVQHEIDHLMGTFFVDRVSEPRRKSVLQKFNSWKEMRRAQIRKTEENGNVNTGAIAVYRS